MARNLPDLDDATGGVAQEAVLRSTIDQWGAVQPTQTRAARATEAMNLVEARALRAIELQAMGGRWILSGIKIAIEVLALIRLFDSYFIDYELTPSGTDSSGATFGVPFGDWAELEQRIDTAAITVIAEQ